MADFATVRGMQDILPLDWPIWDRVMAEAECVARTFGYRRIETPTLAQTELFVRTTGEGTDIVEKEMYSFEDKGGDHLTLRPEGTAPVVRAYLQHGMHTWPQPVKLYYFEHMFRRENPQRGRYREHHQFGCEAIGMGDAYVDVEMISLLVELYRRLGLPDLVLLVNSIGDHTCRPAYVERLVHYLREHESQLAPRDRERLERNPLRVLDTKEHQSLPVVARAPSILDSLCDACSAHWYRLRHGLDILGIEYRVDPHLVRGLDYYTRTVFEFQSAEEGAASTVNGGGRYDALAQLLGGPPTPGIGFGLGIDRLVLLLQSRGITVSQPADAEAFVAHVGEGTEDEALRRTWHLRQEGVPAVMPFGHRSLKAQLKAANTSRARVAVIIGEDELAQGSVAIRDLQDHQQRTVPAIELPHHLRAVDEA
jgi:histidyl-tRNA synthetase